MPRKVTKEDMEQEADGPTTIKNRIGINRLLDKLEAELEACETKVFSNALGVIYSDDLTAWNIRQKARMDAHKLRGDYPAEKFEGELRLPNAMALVVEARQQAKKKPKKKPKKKNAK